MKIGKTLKESLSILLLSSILVLTACHTSTGPATGKSESQESGDEVSKNDSDQHDSTLEIQPGNIQAYPNEVAPTGDFGYKLSTVVNAMAITEKGYYFIANEFLYFYDIASGVTLPMCSRTECRHFKETCDAYIRNIHEGTDNPSFSCDRQELFYYNDKLYMVECSQDLEYYLCRYSATYNDKERVALLASFKEDSTYVSDRGAYTILDGYFYYYEFVYDYRAQLQGEYMIELNCMRIKMTKGAVPEKLGSFKYAGDVTLAPEGCEGITVLTDSKNVYYVASHVSRMFSTENKMEYILAKYSVSTKEFTILDSYVGDPNQDVWGKGLGLIHCNPNRVCMAEDSTMYINTEQTILAINLETNERKKIYTSPYEGDTLIDLAYDGQYLYFIESQPTTATYLTTIDTNGNLIRRYKFEYLESYESMLENSTATIKPARVTGNISLLGVTNEHILVASTSHVYKDLSGSPTTDTFTSNKFYGVGLLKTSDFLENREIQIEQIYQY